MYKRQEEGQPQIKKDYDTLMQSLRTKVDDVQKSVVIIQESTEGLNYENYFENRENVKMCIRDRYKTNRK